MSTAVSSCKAVF